jgi:hypothetical protein
VRGRVHRGYQAGVGDAPLPQQARWYGTHPSINQWWAHHLWIILPPWTGLWIYDLSLDPKSCAAWFLLARSEPWFPIIQDHVGSKHWSGGLGG